MIGILSYFFHYNNLLYLYVNNIYVFKDYTELKNIFDLQFSKHFRYRVDVTEKVSNEIRHIWTPPTIGNLHWDGKHMQSLNSKYEKMERLSVSVSGKH